MIEIRKLQEGDIEYARRNPLEEAVKGYPDFPVPKENCYTGLVDGKIIGVYGVTVLWEGVGELWLILTKDVLNFKVETYKRLKQCVEELIGNCNLRRTQAVVRTDFPQAIKMMEHLGFEREGLLIDYCPDKCDVYMYAKIRRPDGRER